MRIWSHFYRIAPQQSWLMPSLSNSRYEQNFYIRRKRDRLRRVGTNDIMLNASAAAKIGTEQEIVITANEDSKLLLFGLD
ncbi:protein of unknown function [Georgfuchsia toluolica]|uniref:Uncharacterized protein n=1 Tax=Georgfuchsia toluolica TaxID=424218 RepID=A0A916J6M4_9PROT|nr:protein of unknown function [Georgfuchsia toluolica]